MLGKLKKVEIREIWKNEATDFTRWLAKEENLALLSDEIGIDIKLIKTEANVGNFTADIVDLYEGQTIYYRAVALLNDSSKKYGAVKSVLIPAD